VTELENLGSTLKIAFEKQSKKIEEKDIEIKKERENLEALLANLRRQLGLIHAKIDTLKKTLEEMEQK
jgi:hypothetical protein